MPGTYETERIKQNAQERLLPGGVMTPPYIILHIYISYLRRGGAVPLPQRNGMENITNDRKMYIFTFIQHQTMIQVSGGSLILPYGERRITVRIC